VNVDAVLFWMVYDPEKAALEVQDYMQAVSWAAQTALRDIIGRTSLADLLHGRERVEEELQKLIGERTNPWGITVQSVEMRDVVIPVALQDAMSREAQDTPFCRRTRLMARNGRQTIPVQEYGHLVSTTGRITCGMACFGSYLEAANRDPQRLRCFCTLWPYTAQVTYSSSG
jgi:hypothetical protein